MSKPKKNIVKKSMDACHQFNLVDISIYKLYLLSFSFLLVILIPNLMSIGVVIYLTFFVVSTVLFYTSFFSKEKKLIKHLSRKWLSFHMFRKLDMLDVTFFKLAVIFAWLSLASLFPVLTTASLFWYVWVFTFWAWYFVGQVLR